MSLYRYTFADSTSLEDVESSLLLSMFGTESLHGTEQVRLDASHVLDCERRSCIIDASTSVGRDLNKLFLGFLRREFGDRGFHVEAVKSPHLAPRVND